jgi:hypothetical protein
LCKIHDWNLGWEVIGNHIAFAKLREIKETDPKRYKKIEGGMAPPTLNNKQEEDDECLIEDEFDDDCDVPIKKAVNAIVTGEDSTDGTVTFDSSGNLRAVADAETTEGDEELAVSREQENRRGKRMKRTNPRYSANFIRHWDEDDPEEDIFNVSN